MSNLSITAADVSIVSFIEMYTLPTDEDINGGQYVRLNTTSGKWELGKATETAEAEKGGIAVKDADDGLALTVMCKGVLDLGEALVGLSFGDKIYLSDTDGTLATTTGTVSRQVGRVWPSWGSTSADRVLRVEL